MAVHKVYRFYAQLKDYSPKIWRRFEVNGNKTMAEFGYILMTLFEMKACHLFSFTYDFGEEFIEDLHRKMTDEEIDSLFSKDDLMDLIKPWRFELRDDDVEDSADDIEWRDASRYRIKDIGAGSLYFEYDYGDGWQVDLTLENCEMTEISASVLPRVLEGQGFGIIEDCGGPDGLAAIAKAYQKKSGSEYEEYREWLGIDDLDLTRFDIEDMNFRLKKLPRIFKESYEYHYEPTQRSIDLIERKYKNG